MRRLNVFNFISMNGYFSGPGDDISWAHMRPEDDLAAESLQGDSVLLFGRRTYELMVQYWPTDAAKKNAPEVAKGMNEAEKIVFSRTLARADWQNTRIIGDNIVAEVRKLKESDGPDLTVLGSGSIVNQFADAGLIDQLQLLVHPLALPAGTPILKDVKDTIEFRLKESRAFKSGNVLLVYEAS